MMNKKHLALLLLLCFVISLGCAIKYYPRQQHLPSSATSEPARRNRSAKTDTVPVNPQTLSVKKESPQYAGYHTDLFRPLFDRPPAPPKPEPKSQALSPKEPPTPPPPLPLEPIDPPEPPVARKLANFTYLGQIVEQSRRSIFLKEKERIFVVNTGENFGEKMEFRLVQVTEKEIRIATGALDDLIRIPLEKKKPLKIDNRTVPLSRTASKYPLSLPDRPEGETL